MFVCVCFFYLCVRVSLYLNSNISAIQWLHVTKWPTSLAKMEKTAPFQIKIFDILLLVCIHISRRDVTDFTQ